MTVSIQKDLRMEFEDARDQGRRPTCMVFAASDAHACVHPLPHLTLCVEYLYFHAVQRSTPSSPGEAVSLQSVSDALHSPGQPIESAWPYQAGLPSNLALWIPPTGTTNFCADISQGPTSTQTVFDTLDYDEPAILTLRITPAFFNPTPEGVIQPLFVDPVVNHHAVVAVGYGTFNSSRVVLVRNSWGRDWGLNGYAWLYESYLSNMMTSLSTVTSITLP